MSLNFEQFQEALRRWDEMDKRLSNLLGFNPAKSDHYGIIRLYNKKIDMATPDEKIFKISADYIKWRSDILRLFAENHYEIDDRHFEWLFSVDPMFGTIEFLNIIIDIDKGTEPFAEAIKEYIKLVKKK